MYFEIDLDNSAIMTLGYVLIVALVIKMFVAINNKKGK